MLRKMFLVSPEYLSRHPPPAPSQQQPKAATSHSKKQRQRVTKQKKSRDKWVQLKRTMEEGDVTRKRVLEAIATFLRTVLPQGGTPAALQSMPPPITPDVQPSVMSEAPDTPPSPSLPYLPRSRESVFAAPIKRSVSESDEGEASYVPGDKTIQAFSEQQFGKVASPYIASYVLHAANVDRDYGMRRDTDGKFRIGNSLVTIDQDSNVNIQGVPYRGTKGLFELLTRKKVDMSVVTPRDMKSYRAILEATHGHREDNDPSGGIKTTRGAKYKDVISKLFPLGRVTRRGSESASKQKWATLK